MKAKSSRRKPALDITFPDGVEFSVAEYKTLTEAKRILLEYGKLIDADHDNLSIAIEDDVSNDDIRDAAIELCLSLNAFHEARKAALGPDAVAPLSEVHVAEDDPGAGTNRCHAS